ncbi:MAG: mercury transporter MerT [Acidobacteriota bacterium]|nr:mercury transporter MerT [Acidobacteriota bacterium]
MKTTIGAVVAALAASACCVGPLVAVMLGAGTLGAVALTFEPYRPWLLGLSGLLLAVGYYVTYRPVPATAGAGGEACTTCAPSSKRVARWGLWVATVLIVLLAAFPYYVRFLL